MVLEAAPHVEHCECGRGPRQPQAPGRCPIAAYARRHRTEIVATFYDAAVSGADPLDARKGFAELLAFLDSHPDARSIVVETANRFARDLIVQETGFALLRGRGIELIAADSPKSFLEETPTAIMVRQILGAVSQFEKASIVAKLKGARDRKRQAEGKCEGHKSHAETRPEAVALAKRLYRRNPRTGERRSLRTISAELAANSLPKSADAAGAASPPKVTTQKSGDQPLGPGLTDVEVHPHHQTSLPDSLHLHSLPILEEQLEPERQVCRCSEAEARPLCALIGDDAPAPHITINNGGRSLRCSPPGDFTPFNEHLV